MSAAAFEDAVVYCVDDLGQYGYVADRLVLLRPPQPVTHLAEVVAGEYDVPATGRRMFLNMGIAMDDIALGSLVLDRQSRRRGRHIEFPVKPSIIGLNGHHDTGWFPSRQQILSHVATNYSPLR